MMYPSYATFSSPFGTFTIVWKETGSVLRIQRIFLSDSELKSEVKALESFKQINLGSSSPITSLGEKIQRFFKGEKVEFDLGLLDFNRCFEVQKQVLLAEFGIPRGWVSTYKRIANIIGNRFHKYSEFTKSSSVKFPREKFIAKRCKTVGNLNLTNIEILIFNCTFLPKMLNI